MTHEDKKIGGNTGNTAPDEEKIAGLLSELKRVEAPKDFEFHVRSRIARGLPGEPGKAAWIPVLKYAMPLALFLMVGAAVLWNSSMLLPTTPEMVQQPVENGTEVSASQPVTQEVPQPAPPSDLQPTTAPAGNGQTVPAEQPPQVADRARADEPPRRSSAVVRDTPPIPSESSTDRAVRGSEQPIVKPGTDGANTNTTREPSGPVRKAVGIRETLQSIGIAVDGNLTVVSVTPGGFGNGIGVKPGDRIEAIDGRPVNAGSVFTQGTLRVRTVRVRRGGTVMDLKL